MPDRGFTRESIKGWIKRKLGYPTIEVELTSDQLEDCIDDALDEIAPWVVQRQLVTLPASECINVSQYGMAYVINVHKASTNLNSSQRVDVFNPYSYSVITSNRAMVYDRLEQVLYNKTNNDLKDNISFRLVGDRLYLDVGYPPSENVTIEYSPKINDVGTITDRLYQRFVRNFALAYARLILSDIRGKFKVSNSPVELDADAQDSKSSRELDTLRQELKDTVTTHFMLD